MCAYCEVAHKKSLLRYLWKNLWSVKLFSSRAKCVIRQLYNVYKAPRSIHSQQTAKLADVCRITCSIFAYSSSFYWTHSPPPSDRSNVMRARRRPYNVIIFNRFLKRNTPIRLEYIKFFAKFPSRLYVLSAQTYYIIRRQFFILWRMPTAI